MDSSVRTSTRVPSADAPTKYAFAAPPPSFAPGVTSVAGPLPVLSYTSITPSRSATLFSRSVVSMNTREPVSEDPT